MLIDCIVQVGCEFLIIWFLINYLLLVLCRSSFAGWKCQVQDNSVSDVDYFSFLFSTLIGNPCECHNSELIKWNLF